MKADEIIELSATISRYNKLHERGGASRIVANMTDRVLEIVYNAASDGLTYVNIELDKLAGITPQYLPPELVLPVSEAVALYLNNMGLESEVCTVGNSTDRFVLVVRFTKASLGSKISRAIRRFFARF